MRENKFQKDVIKALKKRPVFIINLHGHLMQRAGLPDLEIIHHRWHGFLELKVEKNKPSDIQKSIAKHIKIVGVPVYVLRCVEVNWDKYCIYTLEDFDGNVVCKIESLDTLLDILIERLKK